jgi:Leucine-rich repeat (LRR) protein
MAIPQWALERIQKAKAINSEMLDLERPPGQEPLLHIPDIIAELNSLRFLKLSYNRLANLPVSVANLKNLTSLDLSFNLFEDLPDFLYHLTNLTTLDLVGNLFENFPISITKIYNLTVLNLADNRLVELSDNIADLEKLITLDLNTNKLANLPEAISKLLSLQTINLSFNEIASLPKNLFALQNLRMLDVRSNNIIELPQFISELKNLATLLLNNNRLTSLPQSMSELKVTTVNLSSNRLVDLPEMPSVESLDISDNQLTELPESVSRMYKLRELNLSENKIRFLPDSITKLHYLTVLHWGGNPLVTPPPEVARRGVDAIRNYFRQLGEAGQDRLYEAKLLVLGEGGAGKTTLAKKVENQNYELHEDEGTTEGVNVIQWSFPITEDKSFRINIWDFGGQEIYHATHQFFLTRRSLYVLVSDTRKEDTDFYYWLNVIELLSDSSPLLIVKNEKQERRKEINERLLKGQFSNLKEILSTNLATNRGLHEIVVEIKHQVQRLPHVGSLLPKTWIRVREVLEEDKRNYISLNEYLEICNAYGFSGMNDSLQLSGYLHDIGVFLHFQDDVLLRKTVILNPKWGTDAVYKILDNKQVVANLGSFTRVDLETIWGESEYAGMYDELLQLMMKFQLCYEIPNQKGVYIAPQLLTENQPDYEWNEKDNLLLRYIYEFMPKGILSQFIVVMHPYISEQKMVWKSGVVLEKDGTRAEIVEYFGKREIRVRVSGVHKKELMTILAYELDQIHNKYRRLKYNILIPCNCRACRNTTNPYFYKNEQLQNFIEKRIIEIQCGTTGNMVNVRSLIDDVVGWKSEKEVEEMMTKQKNEQRQQPSINVSNVNISGDAKVDGLNVGVEIQASFHKVNNANISGELKETLKQLTQAVDNMRTELPKEQAIEVLDDLEKLVEEATKSTPNKKWYSVSISGLIKAAENLGKVGEPVIELSRKVLSLLTMGTIK